MAPYLSELDQLLRDCLGSETPDAETSHRQSLVNYSLAHPDTCQAFLPAPQSIDAIAVRSRLLRKIYPDFDQFCQQTLGWSHGPLSVLWTFWLPLAQWIADQQQQAGRPLVQGILGVQGSGKTTLTTILSRILVQLGHKVCRVSIDDFYKTYPERLQLQQADPRLIWRGPPGTHDIDLVLSVLEDLRAECAVTVPRFDKSARGGQGDRAGFETFEGVSILLLEGWFVGARPVPPERFDAAPWPIETERDRAFARDSNEWLRAYLPLWDQLDRLLVLYPANYKLSMQWRREAEQSMAAAGRSGMDDTELDRFVLYFWRALHPELFVTPLLRDQQHVDWVVEIDAQHNPLRIYSP